ncbi:hypothetical protein TERTU_3654 [Teredinibacter turnerae T7901]|uniref:Uncharacterized protein n=1 Tax=Teredinibacter turnerae (strain ATCC 39867 / T7901) TaxID=377629 RepID=C5BS42_TERTT|nr:hypothetical protein TERTU_3654 [Teredinibacter turnerae T7901]
MVKIIHLFVVAIPAAIITWFTLFGFFDVDLGPVNTNFGKICDYGKYKIAVQNNRTPAAVAAG